MERAVIVCTDKKGVFFGYASEMDFCTTITLKRCRMCIYWSEDIKGVLGLASKGPSSECKISEQVEEIQLNGVHGIFLCSDKAVEAWEKGPWKA